ACRTRESRQIKKAARVLPDPVGAEIKTSRPAAISGQPLICGSVGDPKREVNHSAMRGSKTESGIAVYSDCPIHATSLVSTSLCIAGLTRRGLHARPRL